MQGDDAFTIKIAVHLPQVADECETPLVVLRDVSIFQNIQEELVEERAPRVFSVGQQMQERDHVVLKSQRDEMLPQSGHDNLGQQEETDLRLRVLVQERGVLGGEQYYLSCTVLVKMDAISLFATITGVRPSTVNLRAMFFNGWRDNTLAMFFNGLPETAIKSANDPGAIRPRLSTPRRAAALTVADWIA